MVGAKAPVAPRTADAIAALLAQNGPFIVNGTSSKHYFDCPVWEDETPREIIDAPIQSPITFLVTHKLSGVVEHHVEDQVVVVRAGTPIAELQEELARHGQTLPLIRQGTRGREGSSFRARLLAGVPGTVGGTLSMNLPHVLSGQCGSWRDWVLGMTVVRTDGTIAKCGSQAVKNVAGYDVQKLFIGSRGTLAVVVEVTLRTLPLGALPSPALIEGSVESSSHVWIQRTLRTDFAAAVAAAGGRLIAADKASSTLWADVPPGDALPRFPGDWILRSNALAANLQITDPTEIRLMKRAKEIFDPTGKLNPGEMGIS